jgi:capsular exopolysaccharide synthesis family protein
VIKVENRDPVLAKQIADSMASVSSRQMVTVMGLEEVNVVEPGNIPTKPSKPKVKLNTAIGGIMGCLLSAVFIIIQYIMDDSIKNSEDIEKHLAITTLGTIPRELAKKNSKTNKKKTQKKKYRRRKDREDNSYSLDKEQLDTTSNESYKSLRTNLQFCGKDVKTICITSCLPNEGKTVVSLRLASTIAEAGKKVLFIDADLRKSVILGKLRIENELYGLSQYLSGMNELKEVINKTSVVNVDMIFTGPLPPNPSEMLAGDMFKTLIMTQRGVYDYILVDTPPLGVVIDSANVAQVCDGTIIVIEADHISYKFAQRVVKQLIQGKCRVLGAVLNKVNMKRKDYYGKNYGKYYGKYYTSNKR